MNHPDLFGGETLLSKQPRGPYQQTKAWNNYRESTNRLQSCKTCKNHILRAYHNKVYHKCALIGSSFSAATDSRLTAVCDKWEAATGQAEDSC